MSNCWLSDCLLAFCCVIFAIIPKEVNQYQSVSHTFGITIQLYHLIQGTFIDLCVMCEKMYCTAPNITYIILHATVMRKIIITTHIYRHYSCTTLVYNELTCWTAVFLNTRHHDWCLLGQFLTSSPSKRPNTREILHVNNIGSKLVGTKHMVRLFVT